MKAVMRFKTGALGMRVTAVIIAALSVLVSACGGKRAYSSWENLPTEGWLYTDTVSLLPLDTTLIDNDSLVNGSVKIALRHSNEYPYSNIWLQLAYYDDRGLKTLDTVKMVLADAYGRWLGSGFSSGFQVEKTVSRDARIDLTRPIELRHILRVDTLPGIEQVGILIEQD